MAVTVAGTRAGRTPFRYDTASVAPAALVALAESGVAFVLLHGVATSSLHVDGGPMASFAAFAFVYTAGVAIATLLRRGRALPYVAPAVAVGMGLVQTAAWSASHDVYAAGAGVVLWLIVVARVVTLALRDWHEPVRATVAVDAALLLFEIVAIGRHDPMSGVLPLAVGIFFPAMLASRATSVRLAAVSVQPARAEDERGWMPWVVAGAAAIAAVMAVVAVAGGHGGAIQQLGHVVAIVLQPVLRVVGPVVGKVVFVPLAWLVRQTHLSFEPFTRLARNLQGYGRAGRPGTPGATTPFAARVIGFLTLLALAFFLIRSIRRRIRLTEHRDPEEVEAAPNPSPLVQRRRRRGSKPRRGEPPRDTVRRWYAEVLAALEERGLARPPNTTPDEFLPTATAAVPGGAAALAVLTRAYDDVRYGSRTFDAARLGPLEAEWRVAMEAIDAAGDLTPPREQT